jgi:hypothetical protein
MLANIYPLRCQVVVPGTGSHKIKINAFANTRGLTMLGTAKYEHRRAPLYNIDGPHSRLILRLPSLPYILLLDDITYVFYSQ